MRYRTHRLRRLAAAGILGVGMTAGVIGVTAGVAGAVTAAKISATAATTVIPTGVTQSGANMKVTLAGSTARTDKKLDLTVAATSGTADFASLTATPTEVTVNSSGLTGANHHVWVLTISTLAATATQSIAFTAVKYTTSGASGNLEVTPSGTATPGPFTGSPVTDATVTAGPTTGNSITATSAPSVPTTGTNNAAGNLTITLRGTAATVGDSFVQLTVAPSGGTSVHWNSAVLHTSGVSKVATPSGFGTSTLHFEIGAITSGDSATLTITGISYNTSAALGTITVTPHWSNNATFATATVTYGTFSPATAVNAKSTAAKPATHLSTTHTLTATSTPGVGTDTTGAAAGAWTVNLAGTTGEGWTKTKTVTIVVGPNGGLATNCIDGFVLFTGAPTVTVETSTGLSTTPTVAVADGVTGTCSGTSHNEIVIVFTNTGTVTSATGSFKLAISGVKYDVGATTTLGNVTVEGRYTATTGATIFAAASTTGATAGPSNADIAQVYVTANTPAKTVTPSAFDATISPINVTEAITGKVTVGYVCVSLAHTGATKTNTFNVDAPTAKAAVTTGTATVTAKVTYEAVTGAAVTGGAARFARFEVTKASSVTPSKFSLSGLRVNSQEVSTTSVLATVKEVNATQNCAASGTAIGSATAYAVKSIVSSQIYGATADATAVHILETKFPATTTGVVGTDGVVKGCVGGHPNKTKNRPVVLATTKTYQDALSAQYLASYLDTGVLLTPTTKLSTVTLAALRTEGVTQVDVVGGPLAITTTIVTELETTPAYSCGGATKLVGTTGSTRYISVTRIWGQTAADTAAKIAETPASSHILGASFTGAYAGVNTTKGNGVFNDTAGSASTAPFTTAALKTAIVASAQEYQDAMAASTLSYWETGGKSFPILLTTATKLPTATSGAIATLGIGQVIVMGGQLAISNTVVKALQGDGVEVVRIAGKNYTDTAVQLAKFEMDYPGVGLNWENTGGAKTGQKLAFARGNGFTDGLTGAVWAGSNEYPLLLVHTPTTVGASLTAWLKTVGVGTKGIDTRGTTGTHNYRATSIVVFGGPLAVSPTVISGIETDLGI